jgi:hypothetical protein
MPTIMPSLWTIFLLYYFLKLGRGILQFCSSLNLPFSIVISFSEQNKSHIVLGLFQASLDVSSTYQWISGFSFNRCRWVTSLAAIWHMSSLSLKMHWNATYETPRHVSNFTDNDRSVVRGQVPSFDPFFHTFFLLMCILGIRYLQQRSLPLNLENHSEKCVLLFVCCAKATSNFLKIL